VWAELELALAVLGALTLLSTAVMLVLLWFFGRDQ